MSTDITWGVTRAPDGSLLKTVFCMHCREVFGRGLKSPDEKELKERMEIEHKCLKDPTHQQEPNQ